MSLFLFSIIASSVPDAADGVRLALEAKSALWFDVVKYAGYAVAIGCAMEAPETFVLIKRWWLLRFKNEDKEETVEDRKNWIVPLAAVGLIIIVAGIVVETFAEGKVSDADALLRSHESDKISKAETEAAEATTNAGTAAGSATTAQHAAITAKGASDKAVTASGNALNLATGARKEADSFEADIKSAQKESAAAKQEAAEAESHLAEARERAAAAEAKVLELDAKLADRVLTDEQLTKISNKLKRFAGQEYEVTAYWESPESLTIANRIHAALLLGAKWKFNPDGGKSFMMGGQVGVQVWSHPEADETTKRAADALVDALNAEGIEAVARQQNPKNPKSNIINVNVGSKR